MTRGSGARAAATPANDPAIDIMVDSPLWQECPDAETIIRAALAAAARATAREDAELAVVLTDDAAIRVLNRNWRKIDKPTDVLSFPTADPRAGLGDIIIAFETTARDAEEQATPLDHHVAHLAVHGFLHLLGYDHETADEADAMERLETAILAQLGIADPYGRRAAAAR